MPPADLWEALSRTDDYPRWWTWLSGFESGPLETGTVARCVVRAPLPYSLRFSVQLRRVVRQQLIEAKVSGDIEGPAQLEIEADPRGSAARLSWNVEVRDRALRTGALLARPLMQWGHEWVVATGVGQFRRKAFDT